MVRREAALSGDAGIGDIRDMITTGRLPKQADTPGSVTQAQLFDDYVRKVLSIVDPSIIKLFNVVLDAGNGIGGMVAPRLFKNLPCRTTGLCMEVDGTFPNHEAIRSSKKTAATSSRASRRTRPISASRGRRRRPRVLHRRHGRVRRRRLRDRAPRRGVPDQASRREDRADVRASYAVKDIVAKDARHGADEPRRPCVLQRRMREENAIFGGEVTGHYYFRDFYYADNGFIPALLILELMSRKGQTLKEVLAAARVSSSPARSTR